MRGGSGGGGCLDGADFIPAACGEVLVVLGLSGAFGLAGVDLDGDCSDAAGDGCGDGGQ